MNKSKMRQVATARFAQSEKGIAQALNDLSNFFQMDSKSLGRARLVLVVSEICARGYDAGRLGN